MQAPTAHDPADPFVRAVHDSDVQAIKTRLSECTTPRDLVLRLPQALQALLVRLLVIADEPVILDLLLGLGLPTDREPLPGPEDDQEEIDRDETTPLCLAVKHGSCDCVSVLLAHGASVDAVASQDGFAYTALHVAAMYDAVQSGIHEKLIAHASKIDALDFCNNTPLHLAAAYGSLEVASALIEAGADVNTRNGSGSSPLHLAAPNGYDNLVDLLLRHGADVDAVDALGHTALVDAAFVTQSPINHYACGDAASQGAVIKLLVEHGACVDATNRDGDPVIAGALRNGFLDAVDTLLDSGVCLTRANKRKETVLHVAARASVDCVLMWTRLLQNGADVRARDRAERSCFDIWTSRPKMVVDEQPEDSGWADASGRDAVARLLQDAMASL